MIDHVHGRTPKAMNRLSIFILSLLVALACPFPSQAQDTKRNAPAESSKAKDKKRGFFQRLFEGSGTREGSAKPSRASNDDDDDDDKAAAKGAKAKTPQEGEQSPPATAPQPSNAPKATAKSTTKKSSSKAAASASSPKAPDASENAKTALAEGQPETPAETKPSNATPPAPQDEATIPFARPVPGRRGMVYPPGVEEIQANMIDVSDMNPGQLARDPRTGKKFRVP
jgi:hypothetical protein